MSLFDVCGVMVATEATSIARHGERELSEKCEGGDSLIFPDYQNTEYKVLNAFGFDIIRSMIQIFILV